MFTQSIKKRPLVVAEHHNNAIACCYLIRQLKRNPDFKIDYCLFEGKTSFEEHYKMMQIAFDLYKEVIKAKISKFQDDFQKYLWQDLATTNPQDDLIEVDKKLFPHGFGQVKNYVAHFILYKQLQSHKTKWLAIDSKRHEIKKFCKMKIEQNLSRNAGKHHNVGNASTIGQKTLLEAAIVRSKFMADMLYKHAQQGQVVALVGERHVQDFIKYTPDLCDVIGHKPNDTGLFYCDVKKTVPIYISIDDETEIDAFIRELGTFNLNKISSAFGLDSDYTNFVTDLLK